ncbi:hypothetical protein ACNKHX_14375 [Shigella flexneri]
MTYIATQIGFASSWMNPFCVVVAQGCRRSGAFWLQGLRIVVWVIATLIGLNITIVLRLTSEKGSFSVTRASSDQLLS